MSNEENKSNPPPDRLQEIADRYGVFIYATKDKVVTCGWVRHGVDCERPRMAAEEAAKK